jgi:hypothetical protein
MGISRDLTPALLSEVFAALNVLPLGAKRFVTLSEAKSPNVRAAACCVPVERLLQAQGFPKLATSDSSLRSE